MRPLMLRCCRRGRDPGFTLIELLVVIAIIALLIAILLPALKSARQNGRMLVSLSNIRQIQIATTQYRHDNDDAPPMRRSRVTGSWAYGVDTWSYGGKNCDIFWQSASFGVTAGTHDEPAYTRMLNPYIAPGIELQKPISGFVDKPWDEGYSQGRPAPSERETLEIEAYKSPGDQSTYQRSRTTPPLPDFNFSSYDDVGTSYHMNLRWWWEVNKDFELGVRRIKMAVNFQPSRFIWIHDQTADVATRDNNPRHLKFMGEFGEVNKTVSGFMDGHGAYVEVVTGEASGDVNHPYSLYFDPNYGKK